MELIQLDEDASEFFSAALTFLDGAPGSDQAPLLDLALEGEDLSVIGSGGGGGASLLGNIDATAALLTTSDDDDGHDYGVNPAIAQSLPPAVPATSTVRSASASVGFPLSVAALKGPAAAQGDSSALVMAKTALPLVSDKRRPARKQLIHSNSNKARDERKLELLYLRQKVQDMEQQLRTLRASRLPSRDASGRKRGRSPFQDGSVDVEDAGSESTSMAYSYSVLENQEEASFATYPGSVDAMNQPQVWKAMCLRQIQHRAKAERENVRLKRVLEGQIKIAKSMEKLLRKPTEVRFTVVVRVRRAHESSDGALSFVTAHWRVAEQAVQVAARAADRPGGGQPHLPEAPGRNRRDLRRGG